MQKTAQKRSVLNKLREMSNVSGIAAEKFFNPKFKEVMETIRKKDDQIRTFVVGKKLGDAEEAPTAPALKDILKQAKSNLNRREYMACATDLGLFHDQIKKIIIEINSIDHKVDEVHHEFLFDKLTPEQHEQLSKFKEKFANQQAILRKDAGIMDFLHNVGTQRGRALAAWEKRYPNEVRKFKDGLGILLQKSEGLLSTIIDSLKEMASARSVRNVDEYIKGSSKILKTFGMYENGKGGFKEFYNSVLKPYIEKMEEYKTRRTEEGLFTNKGIENINVTDKEPADLIPKIITPTFPEVKEGPVVPPTGFVPEVNSVQNDTPKSEMLAKEMWGNTITPTPPNDTIPVPPPNMKDTIPVAAHRKFYNSLQALSNESPLILGLYIKKYANSIKNSDPKVASKLFQISQRIKG
jgi:hypothetical protein